MHLPTDIANDTHGCETGRSVLDLGDGLQDNRDNSIQVGSNLRLEACPAAAFCQGMPQQRRKGRASSMASYIKTEVAQERGESPLEKTGDDVEVQLIPANS